MKRLLQFGQDARIFPGTKELRASSSAKAIRARFFIPGPANADTMDVLPNLIATCRQIAM
jgi:hypothetical protein